MSGKQGSVKGLLVRVGIDNQYGQWNAPVDPSTGEFVYVTIPEDPVEIRAKLARRYDEFGKTLEEFGRPLPRRLAGNFTHLDPDFDHLTYGDTWPRSKPIIGMERGDFLAFYAGLGPTAPTRDNLVYAIIGFYLVDEVVRVKDVPATRWHENAHTRREGGEDDVVVRAQPKVSGRLTRCIPIGEYRDKSYRVRKDLLQEWGGLGVKDGFIQRSGALPAFTDPKRFYAWFKRQKPELVRRNN
jgi:hypothetical protein